MRGMSIGIGCSGIMQWVVMCGLGTGCVTGAPETAEVSSDVTICQAGTMTKCSQLGASFSDGTATCSRSGEGWDISSCSLAAPDRFEVVKPGVRNSTRWSDARCNDGTPFAFYVRPEPTSHDWVIYLQGGIMCDDNSYLCSDREVGKAALITTVPDPDKALVSAPTAGLVSLDPNYNPDFANTNVVYAHYCSSDMWSGATTAPRPNTATSSPWYFSGHRDFEAMLEILAARYGLDDTNPNLHVLLTGGSAGGFGAHLNSSRAEAALPATAAAGRLQLAVDAGWWIEWDWDHLVTLNGWTGTHYMGLATGPDRQVAAQMHNFWGAAFDPACEAAHPAADCLFGPFWYPQVSARVPVFVQQSTEDAAFAEQDHKLVHGTQEMDEWRTEVESSLSAIPWLFSGGQPYHTFTASNAGLQVGPLTHRLVQQLDKYWTGAPSEHLAFSTVRPAVTIDQAATQPDPTSSSTIVFEVELSEAVPVGNFPGAAIQLTNATSPIISPLPPGSTTASRFRVTVTATGSSVTVSATIPAGGITDALGNTNTASKSSDNQVFKL
jgi:hypothetical protein